MDWAAMVMQMYKLWAQRNGYKVTVVDEMPGEIAGIKVIFSPVFAHPYFQQNLWFVKTTRNKSVQTQSKRPICPTISTVENAAVCFFQNFKSRLSLLEQKLGLHFRLSEAFLF